MFNIGNIRIAQFSWTLFLALITFSHCCLNAQVRQPEAFSGRQIDSLSILLEDADFIAQVTTLAHLQDTMSIEAERRFLNSIGVSGADYLFGITDVFIRQNPVDGGTPKQLNTYATVAEGFHSMDASMPDSLWIYDALFDRFATEGSQELQRALDEGEVDADDEEIAALRHRYAELKYNTKLKVSNASKVWMNLKRGNFGYLYHKGTTTYRKEASWLAIGGIVMLALIFLGIRTIKRKVYSS